MVKSSWVASLAVQQLFPIQILSLYHYIHVSSSLEGLALTFLSFPTHQAFLKQVQTTTIQQAQFHEAITCTCTHAHTHACTHAHTHTHTHTHTHARTVPSPFPLPQRSYLPLFVFRSLEGAGHDTEKRLRPSPLAFLVNK